MNVKGWEGTVKVFTAVCFDSQTSMRVRRDATHTADIEEVPLEAVFRAAEETDATRRAGIWSGPCAP